MAAPAKVNLIVDAVVTQLGTIVAGATYRTTPVHLARGVTESFATQVECPALAVEVEGWTTTPLSAQQHERKLRIAVLCKVQGDAAAGPAGIVDLATDVEMAMAANETLGGTVLSCYPEGDVNIEIEPNEQQAIAYAKLTFVAIYRFGHPGVFDGDLNAGWGENFGQDFGG